MKLYTPLGVFFIQFSDILLLNPVQIRECPDRYDEIYNIEENHKHLLHPQALQTLHPPSKINVSPHEGHFATLFTIVFLG